MATTTSTKPSRKPASSSPPPLTPEELARAVERATNALEDAMEAAYLEGLELIVHVERGRNRSRMDPFPRVVVRVVRLIVPKEVTL